MTGKKETLYLYLKKVTNKKAITIVQTLFNKSELIFSNFW